MQRATLAGADPSSGIIAGGPTYQQIPTSAEADAGLNAEIERLQSLSQVAEDQDMGLSVGSNTDVALGKAGLILHYCWETWVNEPQIVEIDDDDLHDWVDHLLTSWDDTLIDEL